MSLLIPISRSEEVVEVHLDELPNDANDILDILKAELAPLDLWLKFALAYYKQGNIDAFITILTEGTEPGLERYYSESKRERIAMHNTLAAYYINLAQKQKEPLKREDYFNKATMNYNRADIIDAREYMTWVGKGVLLLSKNEIGRASEDFDNALKGNPKNIPALLGKGCVLYNKGHYHEALKIYQQILKINPNAPANVRIGLGLCFYKLGNYELSELAFSRVIELDPTNVPSLIALGVLELNCEKENSVKSAMTYFKRAFDIDPSSSMVLNHLANHFFFRQDYKKSQDLALNAFHNTDIKKVQAESCYHIARSYHSKGEYDSALKYYYQAVQLWPEFRLAQFRLGQMYIYKQDMDKAIHCFEDTLTAFPDNYETLKILGFLYSHKNKKEPAQNYLKKVTEIQPSDHEAWIELAQLIEDNSSEALKAYERGRQIMEGKSLPLTPEIWNNIGVLRYMQGLLPEAEEAYLKAIQISGNEITDYALANITTIYNLARLKEYQRNYKEATIHYKEILKKHPNYTDCYLRLGCIAQAEGKFSDAEAWFRSSFQINESLSEAWCLLGNLYMEQEKWNEAQKFFEEVLKKQKDDNYSLISLGNIYYIAKFDKREIEKQQKYLKVSFNHYWRVLQSNPSNIYAANGVGIFMAETGKHDEANEIFGQVREATNNFPDVWLNLAHSYVSQKQYINAIKLYQNCSNKFYDNREASVLLFLARAYYEAEKYDDCSKTLQRAIHLTPYNKILWFDLALSQEAYYYQIGKKESKTSAEMRVAINRAKQATKIFQDLIIKPDPEKSEKYSSRDTFISNRATIHFQYCEKLVEAGQKELKRIENEESLAQMERERIRKEREAKREEELAKERKRLLRLKKLEEKQQQLANEVEAKAKDLIEKWTIQASQEKNSEEEKKPKRKRKSDQIEEEEEEKGEASISDTEKNWEERAHRKRKKEKASKKDKKKKRSHKDKKKRKKRKVNEEGEEEEMMELEEEEREETPEEEKEKRREDEGKEDEEKEEEKDKEEGKEDEETNERKEKREKRKNDEAENENNLDDELMKIENS